VNPLEVEPERPKARGAEATIRAVDWWGFKALLKERDEKGYRPKALDDRLRKERTRTEARLLGEARRLGVRTPVLYDVDLVRHRLILEELEGPTLKQLLDDAQLPPERVQAAVGKFGSVLGRLHAGGISHGDLTSSNVIFAAGPEADPALIDLSMGDRNGGLEELGIDLHLVEEDFRALRSDADTLWTEFLRGYAAAHPTGVAAVEERAKEIRGRVRYS
jgi:Kae1-associated kinase Bud32